MDNQNSEYQKMTEAHLAILIQYGRNYIGQTRVSIDLLEDDAELTEQEKAEIFSILKLSVDKFMQIVEHIHHERKIALRDIDTSD